MESDSAEELAANSDSREKREKKHLSKKRLSKLPPSCTDLCLPDPQQAFEATMIYEILRRFSNFLRLSPFRLEDFCAAINAAQECSSLLNETFVSLLRLLIKDDNSVGTSYCGRPAGMDGKESLGLWFNSLDIVTWPEICREYLNAQVYIAEYACQAHLAINSKSFPFVSGELRLAVLRVLVDMFLLVVRDELNNHAVDNNSKSNRNVEECCRNCRKKQDLIRCCYCPAFYCSNCANYSLATAMEDTWSCAVCTKHYASGIHNAGEKFAASIQQGVFLRRSLLGIDKDNYHYWFVARRLFVEEVKQGKLDAYGKGVCIAYYSSLGHINYVFNHISRARNDTDQELAIAFAKWMEVINEDASLTKELTLEELEQIGLSGKVETALNFDLSQLQFYESKMSLKPIENVSLFRLGDSGCFRSYENQYTVNPHLALTLKQQKDDNDKKRSMSNRFSVLPPYSHYEIKWKFSPANELTWTYSNISVALRNSILNLENAIPRSNAFFMPSWLSSPLGYRWRRGVDLCSQPKHFALALLIFESNIRLFSFLPVWNENGGHMFRLNKVTRLEREEAKIRDQLDKRLQRKYARQAAAAERYAARMKAQSSQVIPEKEDRPIDSDSEGEEEGESDEIHVKFSKKVKHSIWKQQGEEYRLSVGGGWFWMRSGARTNKRLQKSRLNPKVEKLNPSLEIADDLSSRQPPHAYPTLDSLLDDRLAMHSSVDDQKRELLQIVKALQQGRDMSSLYPPSLLPLPESLPACIRHFSINMNTTIENLKEMLQSLAAQPSDRVLLKRGLPLKRSSTIPSKGIHRFQVSAKKALNIFIPPRHLSTWLARRGGFIEICPGYFHQSEAKMKDRTTAGQAWYGGIAPRPNFRTAWEFRCSLLANSIRASATEYASIALQIRSLAACINFEKMNETPPNFPSDVCFFSETINGETSTRELQKARLHSKEHRRFEYLVRVATESKEGKLSVNESWVADSYLTFWEVRYFHERMSRQTLKILAKGSLVQNEEEVAVKPKASPGGSSTAVMQVPSPKKNSGLPDQSDIQELKITQLNSGHFQVKGLLPGQFMVKAPDGSFQFITLTPNEMMKAAEKRRLNSHPPPEPVVGMRTPEKSASKNSLGERTASLKKQIMNKRRTFEEDVISPLKPLPPTITSPLITPPFQQPVLCQASTTPVDIANSLIQSEESSVLASPAVASVSRKNKRHKIGRTESPSRSSKRVKKQELSSPQPETPLISDPPNPTPLIEDQLPFPNLGNEVIPETVVSAEQELYCICRTPYNPTLFYIGCEECGDWFHGACVGISELQAQSLDVYYCENCRKKKGLPAFVTPKVEVQPTIEIPVSRATTPKCSPKKQKSPQSNPKNPVPSRVKTPERVKSPAKPAEKPASSRPRQKPTGVSAKVEKKSPQSTPKAAVRSSKPGGRRVSKLAAEQLVAEKTEPIDNECEQAEVNSDGEELYCICRTIYDTSEFYISCDSCEKWYHGKCVFIAECEAKWIVKWLCPKCRDEDVYVAHTLHGKDDLWNGLANIVAALLKNKKSWPFHKAVDRNLYPIYYSVIKCPVDLSLINSRIANRKYEIYDEFKYDILLMLDNCRRFNAANTKFYHCADEIQKAFIDSYRAFLTVHDLTDYTVTISKSRRK